MRSVKCTIVVRFCLNGGKNHRLPIFIDAYLSTCATQSSPDSLALLVVVVALPVMPSVVSASWNPLWIGHLTASPRWGIQYLPTAFYALL